MMKPGTVVTVSVIRKKKNIYFIETEGRTLELPEAETTRELQTGENIDIFIYTDKQGNITASMRVPDVTAETFGWASVTEVVPELGVFINLNLPKDILVPKDDLPLLKEVWPVADDQLFVILTTDKQGRMLARTAGEEDILARSVPTSPSFLHQTITGRVYRAGKAGSFIFCENNHRAFLHPSQRKREPRMGEKVEVRVIDVKDDGTINVSQLPDKTESMDEDAHSILLHLSRNRGEIPFSDKSSPEDIEETFHISKAAFKRAVGRLMKKGLVEQTKEGTIRTRE
ncbi:CvfB family protein [Salibacterium sp. K-3]